MEGRWVTGESASRALGWIRLINGLVALLAPSLVARRLVRPGQRAPAAQYVLRMFGIRTVLLGLDLLRGSEAQQAQAVRRAPVVHGVDAAAAVFGGLSRQLPASSALALTAISGVNFALAVNARRSLTDHPS